MAWFQHADLVSCTAPAGSSGGGARRRRWPHDKKRVPAPAYGRVTVRARQKDGPPAEQTARRTARPLAERRLSGKFLQLRVNLCEPTPIERFISLLKGSSRKGLR